MLIRRQQLEAIAAGRVSLAFRRWRRPTVKAGGTLRTAIGVLAIDSVEVVDPKSITASDAKAAGYPSLPSLRDDLAARSDGLVYRVRLRLSGADARVAPRERAKLEPAEVLQLRDRLARLDARSRHGPWTEAVLRSVATNPGLYSGMLAERLGYKRIWLKTQIRKLKELGLTESLEVGYRLSKRGEALLRAKS
jgi:hypothetical protein